MYLFQIFIEAMLICIPPTLLEDEVSFPIKKKYI